MKKFAIGLALAILILSALAPKAKADDSGNWTQEQMQAEWSIIKSKYPAVGDMTIKRDTHDGSQYSGITVCEYNKDYTACNNITVSLINGSFEEMRPVLWHEAGHVLMFKRLDTTDQYLKIRPINGLIFKYRWYEVWAEDFRVCNGQGTHRKFFLFGNKNPDKNVCDFFVNIAKDTSKQ